MKREKELAKNTLILSFGTFLPKFAALITVPIITGNLTKAEYGTYDLITTLVSLLLPIVTLQIQSAAFRFLIDCRNDEKRTKQVVSNIYIFTIPVSIATVSIVFFCLNNIKPLTRILIPVYFLVDILLLTTQQIIRGLSKNKLYSISAVIQSVLNLIMIVLTVSVRGIGLDGVLISFIFATSVSIVILLFKGAIVNIIDFSFFSTNVIKQMLQYSWPMVPNRLSNWVLSVSDRLVLTTFIGLESVAVYGAANKLPHLLSTLQSTFIFAWQENASLALSDDNVKEYYSQMFDRIFCLITGALAVLIAATPVLFSLLIKGDYADAYLQMPFLFLGIYFSTLSAFLGGIYVAHKKTKSVGITTMIAALVNLTIDLVFVKSIGLYAASISTLVSYLFLTAFRMIDVKKFQDIGYHYVKIGICLLLLIIMCILCWLNTIASNIANLILGCCFALYINRKSLKNMYKSIIKKG